MRIEKLEAVGYQGLNFLSLDFDTPITLIAGKNATGKTSVKDAIEFALTGLSRRVSLKKNYDRLVRRGSNAKNSQVSLTVDGFTFSRKTVTAKAAHEEVDTPIVLPHLLGSSRFARLPHSEQGSLLFAVSGVKRDIPTIKALMSERGVSDKCVEKAATMVRAGFAAAVKSCKSEQSRARGRWEGITSERFGEAKAVNWQATVPEGTDLAGAQAAKAEIEEALPDLRKEHEVCMETLADVHTELKNSGGNMTCPDCKVELRLKGSKLVMVKGDTVTDVEALKAAHAKAGEASTKVSMLIRKLEAELGNLNLQITLAENAEQTCEIATKSAADSLEEYGEWKKAAEALAPTGIPLQLLEKGLKPINERLVDASNWAGWKPIVIHSDLSITYGGIEYDLCSESEQWRIDAGICECFALLSNVKLFVLDRMDVLHPEDRSGLLNWLIKVSPDHDSIIVLATLKNPPKGLPDEIKPIWLEEGNQQLEKAA